MPILLIFIGVFAGVFLFFRRRGEKNADAVHKGLVAAIIAAVLTLGIAAIFDRL